MRCQWLELAEVVWVVAVLAAAGCGLDGTGLAIGPADAGGLDAAFDASGNGTGAHTGGGADLAASGGGTVAAGGGGGMGAAGGGSGLGARGGAANSDGSGGAMGTCGPLTCPNGCCDGDSCVTTDRSRSHCGSGGTACGSCRGCFQCGSQGTCELDPTASWTLTCRSAVVAAMKPGGGPWDMGPGVAPDPFCEFQINEIGQRNTAVETDTLVPAWNQFITPRDVPLTSAWLTFHVGGWSILVSDYDGDGEDNDALCEIFPTLTPADFSAGTVTFSRNDACASLTIQLACDE